MYLSRRSWIKLAGLAAAGPVIGRAAGETTSGGMSRFDGKALDGWVQIENSATSLAERRHHRTPAAFAGQTDERRGRGVGVRARPVAGVRRGRTWPRIRRSSANAKTVMSALVKDLNQVISGPSIYEQTRFRRRRSSARDGATAASRIRADGNWRG